MFEPQPCLGSLLTTFKTPPARKYIDTPSGDLITYTITVCTSPPLLINDLPFLPTTARRFPEWLVHMAEQAFSRSTVTLCGLTLGSTTGSARMRECMHYAGIAERGSQIMGLSDLETPKALGCSIWSVARVILRA